MFLYDRLSENIQLFNVSLWDSNRDKLFISSTNPYNIFLLMLAVCLLVIVVLGFGFYLWFFITGSEHSQVRLLNILNAYHSVGCIEGSVIAFITMIASGLGYQNTKMEQISVGFMMVGLMVGFLLISIATLLNQFNPEVYLKVSVAWRHSLAIPTIVACILCIFTIIYIHSQCCFPLESCMKASIRRFLIIPGSGVSFLLQIIVIIDDIWDLKRVINMFFPTNETTVIELQNPALGLQNHVVSYKSNIGNNLIKTP